MAESHRILSLFENLYNGNPWLEEMLVSTLSFEKIYPPEGQTYYEHIHGNIQHDAYHLGQIVMLAKHPTNNNPHQ